LFAWWKDAVALHYYITQIKKLAYLIGFKYHYEDDREFYRITNPMKKYLVVNTPGAFGSFLSWLIDCYLVKEVGKSPFLESGNSHGRKVISTSSWDIVLPSLQQKYKDGVFDGAEVIGIHWPDKFFSYVLHASLDRTHHGQYGASGVAFAEKNFHDFVHRHDARLEDGTVWMTSYLPRLKEYFNFDCNADTPTVPRLVLRNLFWLNMAAEKEHTWTTTNDLIKQSNHAKISIETILDYNALRKHFSDMFGYELDFAEIHKQFIDKNKSLSEFNTAMTVIDAVKNNQHIAIPSLSVVAECIIMWYLEKHFFNIYFFNIPFYFKNTSEILEYVDHYPSYMKNPNKFYQTNWRDFKNE
jgi:hypothetical protein